MTKHREKFATQVDENILADIRKLAREEGRQIQSLTEEAFADLLEKRQGTTPRRHVLNAYQTSHDHYKTLYKKLAE